MKRFIFTLFFIVSITYTNAQHCGYDFAAILLVDVVNKQNKPIDGLIIRLKDADQNYLLSRYIPYGKTSRDTVQFQHSSLPYNDEYNRNNLEDIWFVEDSYGLILNYGFEVENYKLEIHDPAGRYNDQEVKMVSDNLFHLCTDAHDWYHRKGKSRKKIEGLEIIEVKLK